MALQTSALLCLKVPPNALNLRVSVSEFGFGVPVHLRQHNRPPTNLEVPKPGMLEAVMRTAYVNCCRGLPLLMVQSGMSQHL